MSADLRDLVAYLDTLLRVRDVPDDPRALNGLQVDNRGTVRGIAAAVDACQATIDGAAAAGLDLLLVHHGLFWGGPEPLTGRHGRRVRALMEAGTALYAAHAPLDVHPEVGNNAQLAARLRLTDTMPFGAYHGEPVGVIGNLGVELSDLGRRLKECLAVDPTVLAFGPGRASRVAVVTGAAASLIGEARNAGADTFITGEGPHHTFFDAEEWNMNVIYAGHYATETLGVKALAQHLGDRYGLPWEFLDHPTGM